MLYRLLSKKYVRDIIYELYRRGEISFSELRIQLGIDKSYLSRLLKELDKEGVISKREEECGRGIPTSILKLTDYGLKVVDICNAIDKLENEKSKAIIALGNNNIIIGNANNAHITLKK
jgi:DNA-binding HxlR family transcriptional regulator